MRKLLSVIVLSAIFALVGLKFPVQATAGAIEISPVSKRLALVPGEKYEGDLSVKNSGGDGLWVDVYAEPNSRSKETYSDLSHWIRFKDEDGDIKENQILYLESGEEKVVKYIVNVPTDASSGGQYATIYVETMPGPESGELEITTRLGMVLYATLPGDLHRGAAISNIERPILTLGKNISVSATVENKGNIDFQSTAEVTISSFTGKKLYQDKVIADVMPEGSKDLQIEWGDTPKYGLYSLDYTIQALGITTEGHQLVLSFPAPLFVLSLILTIAAIVAVVYLGRAKNRIS